MVRKKTASRAAKKQKRIGKRVREFAKKRRAEVVKKFSKTILEKYGRTIKAIIAMGSVARGEFTGKSDIDLVIVVDDTRAPIEPDKRREMDDFIYKTAKDIEKMISPQPVWTLTEWTEMIRKLSPLAYNVLKDGIPVYDTGFFMPYKRLLTMGRLPATKEAAEAKFEFVPKRLRRAKHAKLYMIAEDLYNAALEATQAVIMFMGHEPPGPKQVVGAAKKYLVDAELLDQKRLDWLQRLIDFRKGVEHREIKEISGSEVDEYITRTEDFVEKMEDVLRQLEARRKALSVQRNYEVFIKASIAALKAMNKLPKDPRKLPKAFKEHLIDSGMISPVYENVFGKVLEMRKLLKEKELEKIPDREVLITREYVRRFIQDIRKIFGERGVGKGPEEKTKEREAKREKKSEKKEN